MTHLYSRRASTSNGSEVQKILKVIEKPQIISFAGGLPAPELFPKEEMKQVFAAVFDQFGTQALQYGPTEGYTPLRENIAKHMTAIGVPSSTDNILITSGSQQALDLLGKIFIDEGDKIIVESPTYLAAISAFGIYFPEYVEVPMDDQGMRMDALEKSLQNNSNVKFIYTVAEFQNPTGRTMSLSRRKKLVELANQYNVYVVEDNPYGELRFQGEKLPPIKSFDTDGRVIYLSTFSKTLAPGLRIAWVDSAPEIINKLVLFKQNADLHTNTISQIAVNTFLNLYDLEAHVQKIRKVYKQRRDLMIETIKAEFPKDITYTNPESGLFLWVELPSQMNAQEILLTCVENNVAFVPGGAFFPNGGNENTFRLNYSNASEENIVEGIKRIAQVLREEALVVK